MSLERFEYHPIDAEREIRVLVLQRAADFSEPLEGQMLHCRMEDGEGSDTPNFEAVSYCWKTSVLSHVFICDGKALPITAVVDHLLRQLRRPAMERKLWIDALCIFQDNDEEKSKQVLRMGQIFSRAQKVFAWLGEASLADDIRAVFSVLKTIQGVELNTGYSEFSRRPLPPAWIVALARFLARPWFSRRWVLQEFALSNRVIVQCGSHTISWTCITYAMRGLLTLRAHFGWSQPLPQECFWVMERVAYLAKAHHDILDLLWTCHETECWDNRDRVFSLLGMVQPGTIQFPISYSRNWISTYAHVVDRLVRSGQFVPVLKHIFALGSLREQNNDWPSWIPSWNGRRVAIPPFEAHPEKHRAASDARPRLRRGPTPESFTLTLTGILSNGPMSLALLPSWANAAKHPGIVVFASQFRSERDLSTYHAEILQNFRELQSVKTSVCCLTNQISAEQCELEKTLRILRIFRVQMNGDEKVGIGTTAMQPGDYVFRARAMIDSQSFEPKSFALVLRPETLAESEEEGGQRAFRLVGGCFLYTDRTDPTQIRWGQNGKSPDEVTLV